MFVSILIAARNEEENILDCLHAIYNLDFPKENYEVWIGNDDSSDQTKAIVLGYIADKPHFHLLDIIQNQGNTKGKANVLAQLSEKAKGDLFFLRMPIFKSIRYGLKQWANILKKIKIWGLSQVLL